MDSEFLDILYLDSQIIVINKPQGLLSVPGKGPYNQDCVSARIRRVLTEGALPELLSLAALPENEGLEFLAKQKTPKLSLAALPPNLAVHRLDMDTSGVMVFALTREAHRDLSIQFQDRKVLKRYVAVLEGDVADDRGEINLPFRVDPDNRPYQVLDWENGRMGRTLWEKIGTEARETDGRRRTRVLFMPLTGRTHQLRLHAASPFGLGCPIVGDRLYGSREAGERLLLHARDLEFCHPGTGEMTAFSSPVPF